MSAYSLCPDVSLKRKNSNVIIPYAMFLCLLGIAVLGGEAWAAAPPSPTSLTATMASSRQINLAWTDNATTETNYYVERSPNGTSSWTVVATLGANITTYQNTGLTQNTRYYYRVRCKAGTTYSSYSNTANATTATLAAPTSLLASVASSTRITLNWTDNTTYETQYAIERSPNGSSSWTVLGTVATNVTTTTNGGLTAGTAYYYRVRAYDSTNYSAYSNTANATTATVTAPAAPTALTAAMVASNKITLSWTDNAINETQYSIERSPNGSSSWAVVGTVATNVTTTTNSGLTAGTAYYYRVRAYNGTIYSAYSNTANTTTATLAAPTSLMASVASSTRITLNWTDNTAYEIQYSAERSPNGTSSWTVLGTVATNVTTTTNSGLTAGTAYYYRVRAYDSINYSAYSNTANQTIRTITASAGANGAIAPSGTVGVANGANQAFIMMPNSGYKIATVTVNGSAVATNPTFTFTNVTSNQTISATFSVNVIDTEPPLQANVLSISKISAGEIHSIAVATDGSLWTWGNGYLGNGVAMQNNSPELIGSDHTWSFIDIGYLTNMTLKSDSTLWAWGANGSGQLGDGTGIEKYVPVRIGAANDWKSIFSGEQHSVALKKNGTLWAWGSNGNGQLGNGTTTDRQAPIQIGSATDWAAISTGGYHTVAIKTNGTLWAWGANWYGQLGDGTNMDRYSPVKIGTATDWSAISAGSFHTVALTSGGALWAWGINSFGQVGDGSTVDKYSPARIGTGSDWSSVSAGGYHTVALKTNGTLWSWGANGSGQLGDGTVTDRYLPVPIGSAADWAAISAGGSHTLATSSTGTLWTWGSNLYGQLGDGTTQDRSAPQPIVSVIGANDAITITTDDPYSSSEFTTSRSVTLKLHAWDTASGVAFMKFSNDGSTWTTPEPYAATKTWQLSSADGQKTVYAMFQDAAGNWSSIFSSSITLDTTAPVVSIQSPIAGSTVGSTPLLMFSVNDGWVTVRVDGNIQYKNSGQNLWPLSDGPHVLRVESADDAGNIGFAEVNFTVRTQFTITTTPNAQGSILPAGAVSVLYGTDQTFTIYPEYGYHVIDVLVDGASVGAVTSYTFRNVVGDHTIAVTYSNMLTITATATGNGTISPSGTTSVVYEAGQTYTITPAPDYHIFYVLVDGVNVGAVNSYEFQYVRENHTIVAGFSSATAIPTLQNIVASRNAIDTSNHESAAIFYYVDNPAVVTLKVIFQINGPTGNPVYQASQLLTAAGSYVFNWDGTDQAGIPVPDEAYLYVLEAANGSSVFTYSPSAPSGSGNITCSQGASYDPYRNEPLSISYVVSQPSRVDIAVAWNDWSSWPIKIRDRVAHDAGSYSLEWDGRNTYGKNMPGTALVNCSILSLLPENCIITTGDTPKISMVKTDPYEMQLSYGEFTRIKYTLSRQANVSVSIIDPDGFGSNWLMDRQPQSAGTHELEWNAFLSLQSDPTGKGFSIYKEGDYIITVSAVNPVTPSSGASKRANVRIKR